MPRITEHLAMPFVLQDLASELDTHKSRSVLIGQFCALGVNLAATIVDVEEVTRHPRLHPGSIIGKPQPKTVVRSIFRQS
ncbi:hypothetical protein ABIE45_005680 [Methylobacterium sp. OAE515]